MAANNFETTNLGWQIQLFQQQVSEWFEHNFMNATRKVFDSGLNFPAWLYPIMIGIAWIIFGLTAIWLMLLLYRFIHSYYLEFQSRSGMNGSRFGENSEAIPVYSVDRWLKQARKFQLEGNYTEACRALYMGMLQSLSDRQLIPQQYSRTDGEYRHLVLKLSQAPAYQVLLNTHEQLCFSDRPISSEIFHTCQEAYSEIASMDGKV
jgi:Domain of unknown function (DUF4129)